MEKIKIDAIRYRTEDKDGKPFINKFGKFYRQVFIKSGEKWYSTFDHNGWTNGWNVGDELEVDVQEVTKGDKIYYNIMQPREPADVSNKYFDLKFKEIIDRLNDITVLIRQLSKTKTNEPEQNSLIDPNNLPF